MINKEEKYREELFKLFESDLMNLCDDEVLLNILKDVFISGSSDKDEILKKILK